MTGFLRCAAYLAATGFIAFLIGRALPKHWFRWDAFPYRAYPFERNGSLYNKLSIQKWQNHVPDMSRLFRRLMPAKRLPPRVNADHVALMLQETCIAEFTHLCLCVTGIASLWLWPGPGGAAICAVNVLLGNLPFILIQRFNRPKLNQLYEKLRRREDRQK